ncbi:MAG: preprotein translocase subunit YajC [Candidatus Aquicultor sp.]
MLKSQIGGSQLTIIIYIVILAALYYFLLVLPQRRRAQERQRMIDSLKVGDEILTVSGIIGTVESIEEDTFKLRVDENTTLTMTKDAIAVNITEQQRQQLEREKAA